MSYGLPEDVLKTIPLRVPVKIEEKDDGTLVIVYKKNFTRIERWIYRHFGGVEYIRRPLDQMGSDVYRLCDGNHTVEDICRYMENKYGEKMEPVGARVWAFLNMLAERNIVLLLPGKVKCDGEKKKKKGKLIIRRERPYWYVRNVDRRTFTMRQD